MPLSYSDRMHGRGAWKHRGLAVTAVVLAFAVFAPALTLPADAASARVALAAKRRKQPVPLAVRRARMLKAMRALEIAKANAQKVRTPAYAAARKPKPRATATARQRRLAAQRLAARRRALQRRNAAAIAARRAAQKKSSSLSLPLLAFLAVLPFVLMGLYLLGSDYLRRRDERPPRKRGGKSLVITRVSDR